MSVCLGYEGKKVEMPLSHPNKRVVLREYETLEVGIHWCKYASREKDG